jgi:hypothetical protein
MSIKDYSINSCYTFKQKLKIFSIGTILGCVFGLIWQELLSPIEILPHKMIRNEELEVLQSETNEKLLKYIEGRWTSSIGDLIVNINDSDINGSFLVIENTSINPKKEEKFKVVSIEKVDGLFGIVKLNLCSMNRSCTVDDQIPIQINKIFGISKTISMTYDTRFSFCVAEPICTRAFKEVE